MAVQERPPVRRIIDDFLLPVGADTGLHGIGLIPADLADIDRVIQNQADGVPIEAAAAPAMVAMAFTACSMRVQPFPEA